MEIVEYMYAGFGKILLSIALADGTIDTEELNELDKMIRTEQEEYKIDLTVTKIVFKSNKYLKTENPLQLLEDGIKEFHLGDHHLTPKLAASFRRLIFKTAKAKPPVTEEEKHALLEFLNYLNERELEECYNI